MKKTVIAFLMLALAATPISAFAEETSTDEFGTALRDQWQGSLNRYNATEVVTLDNSPDKITENTAEEEVITSPLAQYDFVVPSKGIRISLYKLEQLRQANPNAEISFVLNKSMLNKQIQLEKNYATLYTKSISTLYTPYVWKPEGIPHIIRAYDLNNSEICVAIKAQSEDDEGNSIPELSVKYDTAIRRMYISGACSDWKNNRISISVVDKDDYSDISYINQTYATENLDYSFKYVEDLTNKMVIVNDGKNAVVLSDIATFNSGKQETATLALAIENGVASATLTANEAFYGINDSSYILIGFYDGDNRLISVKSAKCWDNHLEAAAPDGAVKAKAFLWDNFKNINPQATETESSISNAG